MPQEQETKEPVPEASATMRVQAPYITPMAALARARHDGLADLETAIDECTAHDEAGRDGGDSRRIADLATVVGEQLVVERSHGVSSGPKR